MNDDLDTPIVLSHLFDAVKVINSSKEGKYNLSVDKFYLALRIATPMQNTAEKLPIKAKINSFKFSYFFDKINNFILHIISFFFDYF